MDDDSAQKCTRCHVFLPQEHFSTKRDGKLYKTCNNCREVQIAYREKNKDKIKEQKKKYRENNKEKAKNYYQENREAILQQKKEYAEKNKEAILLRSKTYREENAEVIKEKRKLYYHANKEVILERNKEYRNTESYKVSLLKTYEKRKKQRQDDGDAIREYFNAYVKNRKENDILFQLTCNQRARIYHLLKREKSKQTIEYLGCSIEDFKTHIEDQFKDGMTWENYGQWHIDHIIPLMYEKPSIEEVIKRLHYTNTQPLWADENLAKRNRYTG